MLLYQFSTDWTPQDIVETFDQGQRLLDKWEHPYAILMDFSGTNGTTSSIVSIYPQIQQRIKAFEIKAVAIGLVARRPREVGFANTMLGIFRRLYDQDIKAFDTTEAALDYLTTQLKGITL